MRSSPLRKKSASSSNDEEDLMNAPSIEMRIQILQQRVSSKAVNLIAFVLNLIPFLVWNPQ